MLIRFDSDVGTFTSMGDVAVSLLRMAGHSGTVPGAILAVDVADALGRLEAALAEAPEQPAGDDDDGEPPVGLRQRAFPLIELMRGAIENESTIRWRQG